MREKEFLSYSVNTTKRTEREREERSIERVERSIDGDSDRCRHVR